VMHTWTRNIQYSIHFWCSRINRARIDYIP
jgi:hypothetical protein